MTTSPPDGSARPSERILAELRAGARHGDAASARAASAASHAAEELHVEVIETSLSGPRALVGHLLGMRLLIPASGVHGPRETPALLYLFGDALAIRPTDDAPLSAVPLYGLHIVLPHVALARWAYRAGRVAHADLDLAREDQRVEPDLRTWTVDDFRAADDKVQVFETAELPAAIHVYQHLGLVRLAVPTPRQDAPVRLKSSMPESATTFAHVLEIFSKLPWAHGVSTERLKGAGETGPSEGEDPRGGPRLAAPPGAPAQSPGT